MKALLASLFVIGTVSGGYGQTLPTRPAFQALELGTKTNTLPFTASGSVLNSQTGADTASSFYNVLCNGCTTYDGLRSVLSSESGAIVTGINAIAGYVRNKSARSGIHGNAVGAFTVVTCEVNNCGSWGLNSIASDNYGYTTGVGTGRVIQNEYDYIVTQTGTIAFGSNVVLEAFVPPLGSTGYLCGTNATYPWSQCFFSPDGVSSIAFIGGALAASGTSINSQPLQMRYLDSVGVGRTMQLQATPGPNMVLTQVGGANANFVATGAISAISNLSLGISSAPAAGSAASPALFFGSTNIGIYYGSGAPSFSATQGSLYLRSDGSSTSTRLYVNTNGTTGWTAFTSAS
jgi:hypothetical protein